MKSQIRSFLVAITLTAAFLHGHAQVPLYNSYPSAAPVIFIDFDGHTVDGTGWNSTGPIYCGASGLTNDQVTEIFNRVAEDYRPFTINITTDSTKYWAAPANRRTRVVVTVTSDWYGSTGGVSFVNSFTWGDNTPAFVFSALLNYNTKNIAEAVAHEAGHTLGLRHQSSYDANCVKTSEYNTGQGTGEQSWAPIMGVGYSRNLTTWYNGQSTLGCGVYQDDLDVITNVNTGISFRTDYQPTNFANASQESFVNSTFTASNIIVKNTYQDMYRFTIPSLKLFQLSAVPFNVGTNNAGANLDLKVTLYNSGQNMLNTYTSSSTLSVIIDTTLSTGDYYFKVEGVGNSNAPDYAILGSYSVQGLMVETPLPLHQLNLAGSYNNGRHLLNWTIDADEKIARQVIEYSLDGKSFTPLATPAVSARSFGWVPSANGDIAYRIHVTFDNNSNHYSNTIVIRDPQSPRPKLVSSVVSGSEVTVTSPGMYDYALYNMNGQVMCKGRLSMGVNTISTSALINGMYLVRYSNTDQQWTERFVKQ